jgi:protein-disulfide isomerase
MPLRLFRSSRIIRRRRYWLTLAITAIVLGLIVRVSHLIPEQEQSAKPNASSEVKTATAAQHPSGPPWRYGNPDARFTVVVYADLECPFCQSYTPALRQWIDTQTEVNLQWHHLPLPMHQPTAMQHAIWVECAGATLSQTGFWNAVSWVYAHTRSDGQGLPPGVTYPVQGSSEQQQSVRACVDSAQPADMVSAQAREAIQAGVNATPSLRLIDHTSERSMILTGPVIGDALLSAIDLLALPDAVPSESSADVIDEMSR